MIGIGRFFQIFNASQMHFTRRASIGSSKQEQDNLFKRCSAGPEQSAIGIQQVSCSHSYPGLGLHFIPTKATQVRTNMKGTVKKAKAKVDQLFNNLGRRGPRPHSPAPPDTDLQRTPPTLLPSAMRQELNSSSLKVATNESMAFPQPAQIVVTSYPLPGDSVPITPMSPSDLDVLPPSTEATTSAHFIGTKVSSNMFQGPAPVCMTITECSTRPDSS